MPSEFPKRGALPSPRSALAGAVPYRALIGAPANLIMKPQQISYWGNDVHGDCVTAEEAFAKACNNPEIFIPEDDVIAWATRHGVLEGAYLTDVMTWMQNDGFDEVSAIYDDGPYLSVDWTDAGNLHSAISRGPVKLGVAADQIMSAWDAGERRSGWLGTGFQRDNNEDHCVTLCGYGTLSWLAQELGAELPPGTDGASMGYAMFTWNTIGIVDAPSMIAVTHEAWLRQPTTVTTRRGWTELYTNNDNLATLAVGADADGRLEVVGVNGAGNIWRTAQSAPGHWDAFGWTELYKNSDQLKSLRIGQNLDGRLEAVGINAAGNIWRTAQRGGNSW